MIIEVTEIDAWSEKIESRDNLPLLLRKLIKYDLDELLFSFIPVKSRISMHGPDGVIITNKGTQYVPEGKSLWEFGVGDDPIDKANSDIKKRTDNPPYDIIPSETTYIQVTSRACTYEQLTNWHKKQNEKNDWKDVRIYDAQTLEEWIESSPPVEKWFANILDIPINNVGRLEDWWKNWCVTDEFEIQPNLVLTDKEYESSILIKYLEKMEDINVRASNIDETIAFLYSVISQLEEKDRFLERCLVIGNEKALEYYLTKENLILIPTFDYKKRNVSHNMIYRPLLYSDPSKAIIELKDSRKKPFEDELKNMGLSPTLSRRYARDSGRNISILKRLTCSNIVSPKWVNDEYMDVLITLVFIGSWNDSFNEDLRIIESLSGMNYSSFSHKCHNLLNEPNSPLLKIGSVWILKSSKDLLYLISRYIADEDLEKFKNVILEIFYVPKECIITQKFTRLQDYSSILLRSILKSLILLSVYGEDFNINSSNINSYANGIVYKLSENSFNFLNLNCHYLNFFAEAAPEIFVDALKKIINEEINVINSLFPIGNYTTRFTYLLWALEHIAWDSLLFRDIVHILVVLCGIEYESNIHNSPFESLKDLFAPNYINTYASFNMRLNVLNTILKNKLDIGWKLLSNLLSDRYSAMHHSKAYWRYLKNPTKSDMGVEKYCSTLENYLLEYVGADSQKWIFVFNYYTRCSNEFRNKILIKFDEVKEDLDNNYVICEELRDIISWHNEFYKNDDLDELISSLQEIYSMLEPNDFIEKNIWAFNSHNASTLSGRYYDNDDEIDEIRNATINHILSERGFEGIKNFINIIECPDIIANYIYESDWDDEIIPLINVNKKYNLFSSQYIFLKSRNYEDWLSNFILKVNKEDMAVIIMILTNSASNRETWEVVETFPQEVQDKYWMQTPNTYLGSDISDLEFYISKLLKYGKNYLVIEYLVRKRKLFSLSYIADTLFMIDFNEESRHIYHLVIELLKFLYENGYSKEKLMDLELKYGVCFKFEKLNYNLAVHDEISKNPNKFCEVVEKRYDNTLGCDNPYVSILAKWNVIPGSDDNNDIDEEYLFDWICKCDSLLKKEHMEYVYFKIGLMLGGSEKNIDNLPCDDVSRIIEDFQDNKHVNLGFRKGLYLKRTESGIVFRNGNFERLTAEDYKKFCQENIDKYPITSKLVNFIAKQFEEQAKKDEIESLIDDWIYD